MPVNTTHALYKGAMKKVTRVRDFFEGEDAVKAKGELYLPPLGNTSQAQFNSYKNRGYLVPAVAPTAAAVRGSIMRLSPSFDPSMPYLLSDIDGSFSTLEEFVGGMITELLLAGGAGYLVEYNDATAQFNVKKYTRENIINEIPGSIVLRQFYTKTDPNDKFSVTSEEEFLELTTDEAGNYIQNIWRQSKKGFQIVETLMPTSRGTPLGFIPFTYMAAGESYWESDPMLLHLANVNCDQYRLSTDLRHGLHMIALPTLFLFGDVRDENGLRKQVKVGPGHVNVIESETANAQLIEVSGAGMSAINDQIKADIDTMAAIGAKMLTGDGGGVKAAETARIDASSETATLSTIANKVDMAMADILDSITQWGGVDNGEFKVNRDFIDIKIDPATLQALLQALQSGAISLNTFLYQLQKAEVLPPGVTAEDEEGRIEIGARPGLQM